MKQDPTADIYKILDEVELTAGHLLATREPMAKIVTTMRGEIVRKMKLLIEERESKEKI